MFTHSLKFLYISCASPRLPTLIPAPYSLFLSLNIIVSYIHNNRNKTYLVHLVLFTCIYANYLVLGNLLGAHIWGRLNFSFLLIINCLLFIVQGRAWQQPLLPSVLLGQLVLLLLRSCLGSYIADTEGEVIKRHDAKDV